MLRILKIHVALMMIPGHLNAQEFFSIHPNMGGHEGQAMMFHVFPTDTGFHVLGEHIDSTVAGFEPGIWPWLAEFNYAGNLLDTVKLLIDSTFSRSFVARHYAFSQCGSSIYMYGYRNLGGDYLKPYLLELDLSTSEVRRSRVLQPPVDEFQVGPVYANCSSEICIAGSGWRGDTTFIFVTLLDAQFNVLNQIEVKGNLKLKNSNVAYYIEYDDGAMLISGDSRREGVSHFDTAELFLMHIDTFGNILEATIAPTESHPGFWLANMYTILRNPSGNWVITGSELTGIDGCQFCYQTVPYTIGLNADFSEVLWETKFQELPVHAYVQHFIFSNTECSDGYVSCGSRFSGTDLYSHAGILFKASKEGDSLWLRRYIPVGWDSSRVGSTRLYDIKVTPDDNLLVVGSVYDRDLDITRPWILHLDKDGCLVPGCDSSVSINDIAVDDVDLFIPYPNPVRDYLYLLSRSSRGEQRAIQLFDLQGRLMSKANLGIQQEGDQYILPVDHLTSGTYLLSVLDGLGQVIEQHQIIKLE